MVHKNEMLFFKASCTLCNLKTDKQYDTKRELYSLEFIYLTPNSAQWLLPPDQYSNHCHHKKIRLQRDGFFFTFIDKTEYFILF